MLEQEGRGGGGEGRAYQQMDDTPRQIVSGEIPLRCISWVPSRNAFLGAKVDAMIRGDESQGKWRSACVDGFYNAILAMHGEWTSAFTRGTGA